MREDRVEAVERRFDDVERALDACGPQPEGVAHVLVVEEVERAEPTQAGGSPERSVRRAGAAYSETPALPGGHPR